MIECKYIRDKQELLYNILKGIAEKTNAIIHEFAKEVKNVNDLERGTYKYSKNYKEVFLETTGHCCIIKESLRYAYI